MEKTVILFSGGRDSTTLVHQMRHFAGLMRVVFVDTGALFPHVVEHVHSFTEKMGFQLDTVHPPMPLEEYHKEMGLPVDLLPIENQVEMGKYVEVKKEERLQSWMQCCVNMMWLPLDRYLEKNEVKIVYLGTREAEPRKGSDRANYQNGKGVNFFCPLWNWSEDEVMDYLREKELPIPIQYEYGCDSLDCWRCTAALDGHGEAKMRFMSIKYPALYHFMIPSFKKIRNLTVPHLARLDRIIGDQK
jgi:3'-phosphoadenosine 5'-phosphosulfate sulfotransferase (PAPS reductase)/FAD synthetase